MNELIHAKLEIAYFDTRDAQAEVAAQVTFAPNGMTLVAPDVAGNDVLWHGERRGQGHYVMVAQSAGMEASLHRFADSTILEGFWRNGRDRGFWRLHLPLDAVIPKATRVAKLPAKARKRPVAPAKRVKARARRAA